MKIGPFEIKYVGFEKWKPSPAVWWLSNADKMALHAAKENAYQNGEWNLVRAVQAYRRAMQLSNGSLPSLIESKEYCEKLLQKYAP